VVGVDKSAAALEVAARNVADHGLQHRIRLVKSDMFAALKPKQASVPSLTQQPDPQIP
jgi:ribosomal protein L3 glutamine methyltransferase